MNKKGFTLLELLAVVIILAITAIIAIPSVLKIVDKTKEQAMVSNASAYIKSVENHMMYNAIDRIKFQKELKNGKTYQVSSVTYYLDEADLDDGYMNDIISIKGTTPKSGMVEIGTKKKVVKAVLVYDEYIVTYDIKEGYKVEKSRGIMTAPTVEISEIKSTGNSIIFQVTASDEVNNIKKITYEMNGETYVDTFDDKDVQVTKELTNLEKNKEYTIKVTVQNEVGRVTVKELKSSTIELGQLKIKLNSEPSNLANGYYQSETVTLEYNAIAKGYYYKTTREAVSNIGTTKKCGEGNSPSDCSNISETTSLSPNTWYYFDNIPVITYDEAAEETANVYAAVTTGYKLTAVSSAVIDKIDREKPTFEITNTDIGSTTLAITVNASDAKSGVGRSTCNYSPGDNTDYANSGTVNGSTCQITGLTPETKVNYKYCVYDAVGNRECKTGSVNTRVKYTAETHTCRYSRTYTKTSKTCNSYAGNYSCTRYRCDVKTYAKETGGTCKKRVTGYTKSSHKCVKIDLYNWKETNKKCIKNSSGKYVWETTTREYAGNSTACQKESSFTCNASNENRDYVSACTKLNQYVSWEQTSSETVSSCTPKDDPECTTSSHAGRTDVDCYENYEYYWDGSGTASYETGLTSCTSNTSCAFGKLGSTYATCSVASVGWTSTGSFSSSTNQATTDPTCSGTTGAGNTDVDCSRSYSYSWGSTNTEYEVSSCSDNLISCDSSHSGQTYVSCSGGNGEYKFSNSNEIVYDECSTSSSFTCDAAHEGQKYITNCTKRSD